MRRLAWRRLYRGPRHDVTVDSWNGRLTFDSRDRFIGKYLYVDGSYEPCTIENAMTALERGGWLKHDGRGTLLDIGANIGMITTALLTTGWFARAVCIEPSPANPRLLRHNLAQNGLGDRATVVDRAMSNAPGEASFELSEDNAGGNRIRAEGTPATTPGAYREERRVEIRVAVDTLDGALDRAGVRARDVALLWMDIQGYEAKCLEGASATLAAGMPVVMEFWPNGLARAGTSHDRFLALMRRHFARAHRILDDRVVPMAIAELGPPFDEVRQPNKMTQLLLVPEAR